MSTTLPPQVSDIREEALARIRSAATVAELDVVRREALGKSGTLPGLRRGVGALPAEERRTVGAAIHEAQQAVTAAIEARQQELLDTEPALPRPLDVTLPGLPVGPGGLHPTIQLMYDLNDAFAALNFDLYAGPEVSSELYEFDNLNFPPGHPARESMDTFWLAGMSDREAGDRLSLRPHLTGASVRYMQEHEPPFRFVYPGRVYRNETADARHERAFYQYEVLLVDEKVPLTAGKFLVDTILDTTFGHPVTTRMRTGYFPFVEPGFEIDMQCQVCPAAAAAPAGRPGGWRSCRASAPHPNVLRAGGLDPDRWTGFYVNVGLDRLVMTRYGIDDVRFMHTADLRFLSQFA